MRKITNTRYLGIRRKTDVCYMVSHIRRTLDLLEQYISGEYDNSENMTVELCRTSEFSTQLLTWWTLSDGEMYDDSSEDEDD